MTSTALVEGRGSALALTDEELIPVLQSSLYPGAKPESIKLVLGYCKAAGLDPMQKPVHLVPMNVKKVGGGRNDYEWRDVVMPGIGLYRVQAARTGELAGIDAPVLGPTKKLGDLEYPEWAEVTVYRMIGGTRVAFTAREYWMENYATKGRDSNEPNAMWTRRPIGQLCKCCQAQALRMAFPELGSQPTADETIVEAGDVIDVTPIAKPAPVVARKEKAASKAEVVDAQSKEKVTVEQVTAEVKMAGVGEIAFLKNKASSIGVDLNAILEEQGLVAEVGKLTKDGFDKVRAELVARS